VPATAELIRLEIENLYEFFNQLGVTPIPDWPSENLTGALPFFLEQLENDSSLVGWLSWYWILNTPVNRELIGGGGFKGPPTEGTAEIGYETRQSKHRQGFAAEAIHAQVAWALDQPDVIRVIAETRADNLASIALLRKLRFIHIGPGSEHDLTRFEVPEAH